MKPFSHIGDAELSCSLGDDGIIYITMGGNLTTDTLDVFDQWSEKVKEAMRTAYANDSDRVLTLIDASRAQEADQKSIARLIELMRYNKQFVTRTAVFGPEHLIRLVIEIALRVTRRTNMKLFDEKDEALNWLLGGTMST
jgi:hypothetical protein